MSCTKIIVNGYVFVAKIFYQHLLVYDVVCLKKVKKEISSIFHVCFFLCLEMVKSLVSSDKISFHEKTSCLVLSFFSLNVEYKSFFFSQRKKNISIGFHVKLFQCLSSHLNWSKKWCKNNWICFTRVPLDIQVSF